MAPLKIEDPNARPRFLETVLWGGLIAGVLDGLDAIVFFGATAGATPARIFQHIASGLLGPASFQGGWRTVALGVVLHFFIATGAATVYYLVSLRLPVLFRKPLLYGPAFGLVVFYVMYYVVVPLSAVRNKTKPIGAFELLDELVAHAFFVGLPIALAAHRSARTSPGKVRRAAASL
jgi:uncharacterized membrane protein YagU involved in acid resistance